MPKRLKSNGISNVSTILHVPTQKATLSKVAFYIVPQLESGQYHGGEVGMLPAVLEVGNPRQALSRLDEEDKAVTGLNGTSSKSLIQKRTMTIVNESGMYWKLEAQAKL